MPQIAAIRWMQKSTLKLNRAKAYQVSQGDFFSEKAEVSFDVALRCQMQELTSTEVVVSAESPYAQHSIENWQEITAELIAKHPLGSKEILEVVQITLARVWGSVIGDAEFNMPIGDIDPPASLVGQLFEKLFSFELARRYPGVWRGGSASEKDLHFTTNPEFSVEMKTSGQLGNKIYGNRSYAQAAAGASKKTKSGYYICVNFYRKSLALVRFGWLDESDWIPQASDTGQMAGLAAETYKHKIPAITGDYLVQAPVQTLDGVGLRTADILNKLGITSILQAANATNLTGNLIKVQHQAKQFAVELSIN